MRSEHCVAYWFCGVGYWETLAVSLFSLRQHYQGRVVICLPKGDEGLIEAAKHFIRPFDIEFCWQEWQQNPATGKPFRRHRHYIQKASLFSRLLLQKNFRRVVLLDADTTIHAPIDALATDGLKVVQFSNWTTAGRRISKRMQSLRAALEGVPIPYYIASECRPAINTGVVSWGIDFVQRGGAALWSTFTSAAHAAPFTDELVLQALLPAMEHLQIPLEVLDDQWNWSPTYGQAAEPIIKHYHGRRHVPGRNKPEGVEAWGQVARLAYRELPWLRELWGHYDRGLADFPL